MDRFYPIGEMDPATMPSRAHAGDAGYDLFAAHSSIIRAGQITPIHTGWGVRLADDEVGLVCPRSGLALSGLTVVNAPGIIDSGYAGELVVIATSLGANIYVAPGMAAAQLVIVKYQDINQLGGDRHDRGFGSSDDT